MQIAFYPEQCNCTPFGSGASCNKAKNSIKNFNKTLSLCKQLFGMLDVKLQFTESEKSEIE